MAKRKKKLPALLFDAMATKSWKLFKFSTAATIDGLVKDYEIFTEPELRAELERAVAICQEQVEEMLAINVEHGLRGSYMKAYWDLFVEDAPDTDFESLIVMATICEWYRLYLFMLVLPHERKASADQIWSEALRTWALNGHQSAIEYLRERDPETIV